jgi:hypothetical protein
MKIKELVSFPDYSMMDKELAVILILMSTADEP